MGTEITTIQPLWHLPNRSLRFRQTEAQKLNLATPAFSPIWGLVAALQK